MLLLIGILIGLAQGLTGAGGTVLSVPLLILLAGMSQNEAAGLALAAAGLSALLGVVLRLRKKQVAWMPALVLAAFGVPLAPVGQWLGHLLPEKWVLVSFAVLVLVVAIRLWRNATKMPEGDQTGRIRPDDIDESISGGIACTVSPTGYFEMRWPCVRRLVLVGMLVGLLSGLYGVGGGFVIVPALVLFTGMTMRQAVASSLVIIVLVAASGVATFLWHASLPLESTLLLVGGACLGMLVGTPLSRYVPSAKLQQLLAVALIVLMIATLFHSF